MSVLFLELEPLLLKLQLLRAELDEQGARTPSGVPQTQASLLPGLPRLRCSIILSSACGAWRPSSAGAGGEVRHLLLPCEMIWNKRSAPEAPPGSLNQTTENWRLAISPAVGLSDLQELVGPLSSQPRSVTANPWAGICPSGSVYSSDCAWTSGRFSFLQGQCDGRFSTFPTLSSPPGPLHIPTPRPNPRLKNPSQTLVRNTENLCVHRKIYFFLHFHSGSPRAVIFR